MTIESIDADNTVSSSCQDAVLHGAESAHSRNQCITMTPFEFLKQQLATGEITLHEYMMICQALSS